MGIELEKHQKITLAKHTDTLQRVSAVLSWSTPSNIFPKYDLDVSAFMLGSDSKLISDEGFIFYNNQESPDGSVYLSGDEQSGGSEVIKIDIGKLSPAVSEISIIVTIHKADVRKHTFDKVTDAKIEIYNDESGDLIASFALNSVKANSTAVHVGTFFQQHNEFSFHAIEESYELFLSDFVSGYTS